MSIDEIHEFINFLPDSDLFIGIHRQSLFDFIKESGLGFSKGAIDMTQNLFSQLFKV